MREQHFDNVATNSFLPIEVEHDLSARFCGLYLKLIGLWLHSFSRCWDFVWYFHMHSRNFCLARKQGFMRGRFPSWLRHLSALQSIGRDGLLKGTMHTRVWPLTRSQLHIPSPHCAVSAPSWLSRWDIFASHLLVLLKYIFLSQMPRLRSDSLMKHVPVVLDLRCCAMTDMCKQHTVATRTLPSTHGLGFHCSVWVWPTASHGWIVSL